VQGDGEWGLWLVHHILSLPLLPLHSPPPLQSGVPLTRDSPPQTAPAWVLPTGCSSSGTAPAWVLPAGSQVLPANLLQHGLLSLRGFTGPAQSLLQRGLPTGSQSPSGSSVGSSMGCRWISASLWTFMDCCGTACLTRVFSMSCRGISALVPGAPPPPPSLTWVCAELFLSHHLLSLAENAVIEGFFFSLLKYVVTELLPPSLMGSALASSRSIFLELAGTGFIRHGENFWQLLTEATPIVPLL